MAARPVVVPTRSATRMPVAGVRWSLLVGMRTLIAGAFRFVRKDLKERGWRPNKWVFASQFARLQALPKVVAVATTISWPLAQCDGQSGAGAITRTQSPGCDRRS